MLSGNERERNMKLGILGTGYIVRELLPILHSLPVEEAVLFSTERSAEKAAALTAEYGLNGSTTDYDALLESGIDTVYVGIPNDLHFDFTRRALRRGKNVIVEKPIVTAAAELDILHREARERGRFLFEAMTTHFLPAYIGLRAHVGLVGEVKIVSFNFSQYSSRYDAFKKGVIAPAFDPQHAGGALMDLNIYNIHALLGLFGAPRAAAYCPNIERGVDTSGLLTARYDGFQAALIAAKDCGAPVFSVIEGTKGYLTVDKPFNRMDSFRFTDNAGHTENFDFGGDTHRMVWEFREFQRIMDAGDTAEAERLLEISREALTLVEDKRRYEPGGYTV